MRDVEITKTLGLLENKEYENAMSYLKGLLLKGSNKQGFNLVSLVKKIINDKYLASTRPLLTKINYTKQDKQFICDAVSAVIWDKYDNSLDTLPQNPDKDNTINIEACYPATIPAIQPSPRDLFLLDNLDGIRGYMKANAEDKRCKEFPIVLFNRVFNIDVINKVYKIAKFYGNVEFFGEDNKYSLVEIKNDIVRAIALPLRIDKATQSRIGDKYYNSVEEMTEDLYQKLLNDNM